MNWAKYADKKGKTADFKSKERDINGKKESYVAMVSKIWDAESGEPLADNEKEYSLSQLESEKARYDADMARAKEYSDGLASAIADYKKL